MPAVTTVKKLWLGFTVLTALLVVCVGAIVVQLTIIRRQVHEMAATSRPRSVAAREIESNVLGFVAGVRHFAQVGDSAIWLAAQADARVVDRYLAEYGGLAGTGSRREMAARVADRWHEVRALGHALVARRDSRSAAVDFARFDDLRLELERFLDTVVKPDAVAAFDDDRATAVRTIRLSIVAGVVLLILGCGVALITSWFVATGVVRAEAAIIHERNQLESTFQALQDGVALFDMDGNLVRLNQALAIINGFAGPEEMKQNLAYFAAMYELAAPDGTPVPVEQWPVSRVLRGEAIENWELRGRRRDTGREWSFSFSGTPVRDEHGKQVLAVVVTRDITDRKRVEDHLRQAQKMEAVGQLTGGIAHDFNNILTVVIANAELMASALPANTEVQEELTELLVAAKRGTIMIARLLQFSRRGMLSLRPVSPGTVVDGLRAMLRRVLPETIGLDVVDATAPSDTVLADTGALEQILVNLCTNARDAMPEGGTLRIVCERTWLDEGYHAAHPWVEPGPYVSVAVSDTGTGMDEETKRRLFEPFFTTKPSSKGTGLGMAMVYGLMKDHGGMVHVYSELGQGTTIRLYFALATQVAPGAVAPGAVAPGGVSDPQQVRGGTETLLLAEDDAAIRRTTKRALEGSGYTVLIAEDGEEALEIYRTNRDRVALVISDLVMPKLGGRQLAQALHQEGANVRILFTSGYSPESAFRASKFPAGVAFLQKPWTLTDLLVQVRSLLDG